MIAINRDPAFWSAVANHPVVKSMIVVSGELIDMTTTVCDPLVLPLASEHGGFLVYQRDGLGKVFELHTLFTPEGWGREVVSAAREATEAMFLRGAALIFTLELASNPRSRPPLSHGWRVADQFAHSPELAAEVRTWVLTQEAWSQSPARRRSCPPLFPLQPLQ